MEEDDKNKAETSSKKRKGHPPGSGGGTFTPHIMNLNAGQDLVDAIYNLSEALPRRSVIINSATGSVSEVGLFDPNGPPNKRQVKFQIITLAVICLVDDDGRHCRAKARCGVILTDNKGITFGSTVVNSLKAAGPVKIIASSFATDVAKESTARILAAAAARNSNSDSQKVLEELEGHSSRLSPTTSTANNQDMKSPSVEDI
ncbi:putative PPC domain-containing protein [Medicago truncatula]|uniref:AT-hook motif nuclear-localized protein n=1 Tax=Medicago truncatula TaxID=3880 RepID=A0A072VC02_MEDTR|nr:AT-hook motif nuclear-localized protein 5 [Medicago truncatula]KEH38933.1 AT hook motif DNA-binding family protein [Medicago truncatula]RHN75398.1 putative PPC domain-containing protein [Medicago truncatula]